jgi:2,4-dienoyl-CoA reductase-like NADH-dependent reductase (Old Yellow Enzyme family)
MYNKYPHLLSPLKINNVVLKNRMTASPSMPHYIQGPEPFPSEAMITHFANKAKSGASMVVCGCALPSKKTPETMRFPYFDYGDGPSQNYLCQLAEAIHFYDSKASMILQCPEREGYDVSSGIPSLAVEGDGSVSTYGEEMPVAMIEEMADEYAEQALLFKKMGFDMAFIHSSYRFFLPSRFLSPLTNKRSDQFGGPIENRARFLLMVCERIKNMCGQDFLIEASISAYEPEGGNSLEDTLAFAKLAEGHLDMIQVRAHAIDPTHPTGFNPETALIAAERGHKVILFEKTGDLGGQLRHADYASF